MKSLNKLLTILASGGLFFMLVGLIWSAISAYTAIQGKLGLFDYGVYTNMIWNCGRGDWFRCVIDANYLQTHLSFTLALLGPVFYVWDHPFALWVVQWLVLVGGCVVLWRIMVRFNLPRALVAAILFLFAGYHLTQSVMLSEFHGVSLYLLLVPWLYHHLCFQKRMVWLPLVLILGLREDAFLVILPLLLYFAVRDKWRGGYIYAAISIVYAAVASFVIFSMVAGQSIAERREAFMTIKSFLGTLDSNGLGLRGFALMWIFLPAAALVFRCDREWVPVFLFPSVAVIAAMGSAFEEQFGMGLHYPAAVVATMIPAIIEALRRSRQWSGPVLEVRVFSFSAWLIAATLFSFFCEGYAPGGGTWRRCSDAYKRPQLIGIASLRMALQIPKKGILISSSRLVGYCCNRADVTTWWVFEPGRVSFDIVFARIGGFDEEGEAEHCRELLSSGAFGASHFDGRNVILQRGYSHDLDERVLEAIDRVNHVVNFGETISRPVTGSTTVFVGGRPMRFWAGFGHRAPVVVAFGIGCVLEPGRYEARFVFGAKTPVKDVRNNWGLLSVNHMGDNRVLALVEIDKIASAPEQFRNQSLFFELEKSSRIEPLVTGGDAALLLDQVELIKQ